MGTGKKFDSDKAPIVQGLFNYFPNALLAVAEVSKYGKEKYNVEYEDQNWRGVANGFTRYTDAAGRHLVMESLEGLYDSESRLMHAAHMAWNALARLEFLLSYDALPVKDWTGDADDR